MCATPCSKGSVFVPKIEPGNMSEAARTSTKVLFAPQISYAAIALRSVCRSLRAVLRDPYSDECRPVSVV